MTIYNECTMTVAYTSPKGDAEVVHPCTVKIDKKAKTMRIEYDGVSGRVVYEGKQDPIGVFRLKAVQGEDGSEGRFSWISDSALAGDWSVEGQRGLWQMDLGD